MQLDSTYIKAVRSLAAIMAGEITTYGGSAERKEDYHRTGKRVLRALAKIINADKFDVRSNKGGPAVPGEITLHTPNLYLQICKSSFGSHTVMFRTCKGMKDYTGGTNQWAKALDLADPMFVMRLAAINADKYLGDRFAVAS